MPQNYKKNKHYLDNCVNKAPRQVDVAAVANDKPSTIRTGDEREDCIHAQWTGGRYACSTITKKRSDALCSQHLEEVIVKKILVDDAVELHARDGIKAAEEALNIAPVALQCITIISPINAQVSDHTP